MTHTFHLPQCYCVTLSTRHSTKQGTNTTQCDVPVKLCFLLSCTQNLVGLDSTAMVGLRSMCCLTPTACCLQGEGGKKAEAVATVLAAVDQARVRKPVHAEGGHAEEEKIGRASCRERV